MVEERVQGGFTQFNVSDLQMAFEIMFNLLRGVLLFVFFFSFFYKQTPGMRIKQESTDL